MDKMLGNNKEYLSRIVIDKIETEFNLIMLKHIDYNRSDVITWGLFLSTKYNLKLKDFDKITRKSFESEDCISSLMSYIYAKHHDLNLAGYFDYIEELKGLEMEDDWWLYIYELFIDNKNHNVFTEINHKELYEEMRKAEISFLKNRD